MIVALISVLAVGQHCPALDAALATDTIYNIQETGIQAMYDAYNAADPLSMDAFSVKHYPTLTMNSDGTKATILVGDRQEGGVIHPMTASDDGDVHFITHVYVADQNGPIWGTTFDPTKTSEAEVEFEIPPTSTELTAYSKCNTHGLWKGATIPVTGAEQCPSEGTACPSCAFFDDIAKSAASSWHADFLLRQNRDWGTEAVYTETDGTKHTPYLTVEGTTVTVKVGKGTGDADPYHPMSASPSAVHYITHLYVVDENDGAFVYMEELKADMGSPATITFESKKGANLTPYSFCNLHGLWKGASVEVVGAESDDDGKSGVLAPAMLLSFLTLLL